MWYLVSGPLKSSHVERWLWRLVTCGRSRLSSMGRRQIELRELLWVNLCSSLRRKFQIRKLSNIGYYNRNMTWNDIWKERYIHKLEQAESLNCYSILALPASWQQAFFSYFPRSISKSIIPWAFSSICRKVNLSFLLYSTLFQLIPEFAAFSSHKRQLFMSTKS